MPKDFARARVPGALLWARVLVTDVTRISRERGCPAPCCGRECLSQMLQGFRASAVSGALLLASNACHRCYEEPYFSTVRTGSAGRSVCGLGSTRNGAQMAEIFGARVGKM